MLIPVSNGELMDKYSILLIKKEFINDLTKTNYVNQEITYLLEYVNKIKTTYNIDEVFNKLIEVNKKLWVIEDKLRVKEKKQEFDKEFIELARSVYFTNDERAVLKKQINEDTDSNIFEVNSYEKYD